MKVFNYLSNENKFYHFNIKDLGHGSMVAIMVDNSIQLAEIERVWEKEDMYYATARIQKINDNDELEFTEEMVNLAQPKNEVKIL